MDPAIYFLGFELVEISFNFSFRGRRLILASLFKADDLSGCCSVYTIRTTSFERV